MGGLIAELGQRFPCALPHTWSIHSTPVHTVSDTQGSTGVPTGTHTMYTQNQTHPGGHREKNKAVRSTDTLLVETERQTCGPYMDYCPHRKHLTQVPTLAFHTLTLGTQKSAIRCSGVCASMGGETPRLCGPNRLARTRVLLAALLWGAGPAPWRTRQ